MADYNYVNFFLRLEDMGFTDAILPFLFIFVIVFAILQKIPILGTKSKRFNAVIAFVIGMFVVVPHIMGTYPDGWDVVEIMKAFLPGVSGVLIAFLMMLVLIGVFGGSPGGKKSSLGGWIAFASFIIIIVIFGSAAGWWGGWDQIRNFFGDDAVALIVMLLVFGIIIAFILSDKKVYKDKDGKEIPRMRFSENLGNFFYNHGGKEGE